MAFWYILKNMLAFWHVFVYTVEYATPRKHALRFIGHAIFNHMRQFVKHAKKQKG